MPTRTQELRRQLIGPGGPFEIVTETIDGLELAVYADRLPHLRSVAEIAAGRGDEQPFLVYGDRRLGFSEFFTLANSVARGWREHFGLGHGDRVAILSANNPEWCLAFWAAVNSGAILVGLNGWWKTDEIIYGLEDSGAKILVADQRRFERLVGHLDAITDLEAVFLIDADPSQFGGDPRLHRFDELTVDPNAPPPDHPIAEGDAAVIFYTSGTTGRPKGAVSTHRNMIANLQNTIFTTVLNSKLAGEEAAAEGRPLASPPAQTVALLTSPLFHVSGCHSSLVVGTLGGVRLVIPEGRFRPEEALRLIEQEQVTIWATVPTMVWRVCEFGDRHDYDTSSVTSVAFGGSPSADELQRMVRETFPNVGSTTNAYGLTESSSTAVVISGRDAVERPTSVGLPMPNVELRLVDPAGHDVAPGGEGEVWIRSPLVMPGYWGNPAATRETITDGWLHTGDIGRFDDDGYLYITDRAKDMIIRGGENIYCVEIEQRLVDHPGVLDAAVIGVAHPELGEEVKAVVQVPAGSELSLDDLRRWVGEKLADHKIPTHLETTVDPLPRNASGKLLKNVLRGEGEVSFAETM